MASSSTKLQRIARPRLADLAAERIGEWIASSGLKPGAKLPTEQDLIDALGLGRSAVREALAKLKAVGVVVTYQGRGAFVADLPFELLRHRLRRLGADAANDTTERLNWIWELREILEVAIAQLAAKRRTQDDLDALDRAIDAMNHAVDDGDWGVEQDAMFHYQLTRATHNPLLVQLIEDISSLIESSRRDSLSRSGRPQSSNAEHAEILSVVRSGDVEAAGKAMHQHLVNGKRLGEEPSKAGARGDKS